MMSQDATRRERFARNAQWARGVLAPMGLFTSERIVAAALLMGVTLCYSGITSITSTPRSRRLFAPSRPEQIARENRRVETGQVLIVAGASLAVAGLAGGLMIAFGVGPAWLARRRIGRVEAKYASVDGYLVPAEDPPEGVELLLRVRDRSGALTEWRVSPEVYVSVDEGTRIEAMLLGRRLVRVIGLVRAPQNTKGPV